MNPRKERRLRKKLSWVHGAAWGLYTAVAEVGQESCQQAEKKLRSAG